MRTIFRVFMILIMLLAGAITSFMSVINLLLTLERWSTRNETQFFHSFLIILISFIQLLLLFLRQLWHIWFLRFLAHLFLRKRVLFRHSFTRVTNIFIVILSHHGIVLILIVIKWNLFLAALLEALGRYHLVALNIFHAFDALHLAGDKLGLVEGLKLLGPIYGVVSTWGVLAA